MGNDVHLYLFVGCFFNVLLKGKSMHVITEVTHENEPGQRNRHFCSIVRY